ncbi:MAG TPA: c-type cytochrome [Polyangiaceae bacterium]|jgi:mono/diheme cytochrome c family protein
MKRHMLHTLFVAGSLLALACSKKEAPTESAPQAAAEAPAAPEPQIDPAIAAASTARSLFQSKCVVCHGSVGQGDGPGAAALTPKPRAFADATWQGSVTDEQIGNTIIAGGAAVGKSPAMPPNPDLGDKDAVVKELVKIVRAFKKG